MLPPPIFLLTLFLPISKWVPLVVSTSSPSPIGVNWGRTASHPLPPNKVIELLKSNSITRVRTFDADPSVLLALSGSKIEVIAGIPNMMIPTLSTSVKAARYWVHDNVTRYFTNGSSKLHARYIAIGDDPFLQSYGNKYTSSVIGAATNIQSALTKAGISDQVKVVVPCSYDSFLSDSLLPSKGHFRPDLNKTMSSLLSFLSKHNSPFLATISPFHLLQQNKNLSLSLALFKDTPHHIKDGHKIYKNIFDLSYDTLVNALTNAGFPHMGIIISQIGWPTDGAVNANSTIAESFFKGLVGHLRAKTGTPKELYIHSLLDEDQRTIADGPFERHWGVFTFDGQAKYQVDLGQTSRALKDAKNVEYLLPRWCVANDNRDLTNASATALEACSISDCTALSPGGSCHDLKWPGNISYAYNSYYQMHDQSPDSCEFGGLGLVTTVDPSVGNCRFSVQIQTSYGTILFASVSTCLILLSLVVFIL